ncbi:MAG: Gfo/Idh/MocA family oxidoreductase [Planctomycetaceae bacterium]|nr:Gfo/Idh/MocA family oxidoreductase [Planctomycetaceae bacterium]
MSPALTSRRTFLTGAAASAAWLTGTGLSGIRSLPAAQDKPRAKVERAGIGAIGLRYQGSVITHRAQSHGDIVALCDVDRHVREQARASFGSTPRIFEDYRDLLARSDVDVVLIGTPDHWHTKMVIDACRAGKDVYCEKPLTLTVAEGQRLREVVQETGRVVQVGSWQRSDHRFRRAVELVRQGRIGQLEHVEVVLGKNKVGGPFETRPVPAHFNWDLWQGQTPEVPYIPERSHYTFRWWYEYSGGQMTDWGAHHIDIARWAIGSEPVEISGTARFPETADGYNVALDFEARYRFASGVTLTVLDHGRNGIMFTGSRGRLFVDRGAMATEPAGLAAEKPLTREEFTLYDFDNHSRPERAGKLDAIVNHMGNFFDCVAERRLPISDVESQHRSVSVCHLGNIAMRLGRTLAWDPEAEQFPEDREANTWLIRKQRAGYEIG